MIEFFYEKSYQFTAVNYIRRSSITDVWQGPK